MSLLKGSALKDSSFRPYLNTGTLYDTQTGAFVPGTHNGMVLNGGLSTTNGYVGRPQLFKSTELMSHMMRVMSYYPGVESFTLDTEGSLNKHRILGFSPFPDNHLDLDDRLLLTTIAETATETFFEEIKKIAAVKTASPDRYMVESPILDPKTGAPVRMFIPTFVCIDSWSKMISSFMQTSLDTKTLGSSDTNMIYMKDGNIKKMIMMQIPMLAVRAGIYFFLSAHIGDVFKLDQYAPTIKDLQHMRGTDKLKEVGSDFDFLLSNCLEMRQATMLVAEDKKSSLYPIDGGTTIELNEVTAVLLRCKNNASGSQLPLVISQTHGILSDLSNYHYIRTNDYFGLLGSKIHHKPAMTDTSVGRTTIREKLTDKKTARAIELLAQLCYIQNNWVTSGGDVNLNITPSVLAETLLTSDGPTTDDILQSRGWWTYDKTNHQPYMSLYDVIAISQGYYKAKGISLVGIEVPKESVKLKKGN
jgi:hypothetical protein